MAILSEPNRLGDVLKYEGPNLYSRERITVAATQTLKVGTIIGRKTSDQKIYALKPTANDGTEVAIGMLMKDIDPTAADTPSVAIVRDAILADHAIVWPAAITTAQKNTAISQLKSLGIIIRKGA